MKFDVCIQNPPYDNGLCNKFLVKSFELAEISVSVMPSAWLLGKKQKTNITKWFDKYGGEIEEINGNDYFDAAIGSSLSINYLDKDNDNPTIIFDGHEYEKCSEISRFSNDVFLSEFKKIVEPLYLKDNLHNYIKYGKKDCHEYDRKNHLELHPNPDWWCVKIANIRGNVAANGVKPDFFTLISNNSDEEEKSTRQYGVMSKEKNKNGNCLINTYFAFNNKNEQRGFINYIKTDFFRCCLYLIKTTNSVITGEMRNLPWFDFSNPIFSKSPSEIDDYLFDKFNISDEIRQHIEELLPDYYGIRKG